MFDYSALYRRLDARGMGQFSSKLQQQMGDYFTTVRQGDYPAWQVALEQLPKITPSSYDLASDVVRLGETGDCCQQQQQQMRQSLQQLMPWRKGPFDLFGVHIDSEWRSDWKWQRLKSRLNLNDKLVLDVGCGNGYYALRMLGAGADAVLGVDPTLRFVMQFAAIKYYLPTLAADVLPLGVEGLPTSGLAFDTVFSMGVIYHRREPQRHAQHLYDCLRPGGELILESLIVDQRYANLLIPEGRYAKMNNVWWIPCVSELNRVLRQSGFTSIDVIDESVTTIDEQRRTQWMQFESLADFLDPTDPTKTIEGYPAPRRAIVHAIRPC